MAMSPVDIYILVVLAFVLAPPIVSLVAMRRPGRSWARIRVIAYTSTCAIYALEALMTIARGSRVRWVIIAAISVLAGRGAVRAWRAWRANDYRPAWQRRTSGLGVGSRATGDSAPR
jgi:hypothetical protein